MQKEDRRVLPRYQVHIPPRFHAIGLIEETAEELTESLNISRRGVYFASQARLRVGTPVELTLRMPREVTGTEAIEARCFGRIIHLQAGLYADGRTCYGVEIEKFASPAFAGARAS